MGDEKEFAIVLNARYWRPCYNLLQLNPYIDDEGQSLIDDMNSKNEFHMGVDVEVANGVHIYIAYEIIDVNSYNFADELEKVRSYFNEVNWGKFLHTISVDIAYLRKYYSDMFDTVFRKYMADFDHGTFGKVKVDPETSTLYFKKSYVRRVGVKFIVTTPETHPDQ
jgi:hypothetical protein